MKLDSRIKNGKTYLDCFHTETAKKFIGKECYIADEISGFSNLDDVTKATLIDVTKHDSDTQPYTLSDKESAYVASLILPCEWVEEPEKKYRAFTLAEWFNQHEIGDVIHYRCKSPEIELRHMYTGYAYGIGADIEKTTSGTMTLGVASYALDYLFEEYELEINGEWQPFGVMEDD